MGNLYLAPYLKSYTRFLDSKNYSIVYWDRENIDESYGDCSQIYRFCHSFKTPIGKLFGYVGFKRYTKKILKKNAFDVIVFLQTLGSVILSPYIYKHYGKKYIVDIRDYSYERNKIVFHFEKKVIKNSLKCVISSEGYKTFLPSGDFLIVHNLRTLDYDRISEIKSRPKNKKRLNIAFIGFVNYQEQHKKLLLKLKNDERFFLSFIGTKANELHTFCQTNGIRNVKLIGRFDDRDILDYYQDVDLVNNLYGSNTPALDYALSNKLYFAAELNMPILTCNGTFMSKISHQFGFGFDVDVDDPNCGDKIWEYYKSIDWSLLSKNCDAFDKKVKTEQEIFEKTICNILN